MNDQGKIDEHDEIADLDFSWGSSDSDCESSSSEEKYDIGYTYSDSGQSNTVLSSICGDWWVSKKS